MNNFQVYIQPEINIKSKYINSLKANHLYFKDKIPKVFTSKKSIEKNIYIKFHKIYSETQDSYNKKIINEIITNQKSHIVAEFKDFLIKDENSEFIWKFYPLNESKNLLISIFNYYKQTSVVFPNYILLTGNKYLYKNIQRKQKLINILEEKNEKDILNPKKSGYDTDDFFDISSKVFNSNILDSILNESNTTQFKKSLFGISTENSNVTDNEGDNKLSILVNNINKIEENYYNDFLNKKILKFDKNIINKKNNNLIKEYTKKEKEKEKEKNLINIKKIVNKVNNKNIIISRNRNESVELSKYSKYFKNESKIKNNKKRAKTESIKNELNNSFYFRKILKKNNDKKSSMNNENENSIENNRKIIYNNIYKTDLYLNINNNIIIKEAKNEKNNNKLNVANKLDLNKLKNIKISKDSIHSDKTKYKFIKKNDIKNLLLTINSSNRNSQKSESKREYKHYYNKTEREKEKESYLEKINNKKIMKHRKNKTDILSENYNKKYISIGNTSRTIDNNQNKKQMTLNIEIKKNNNMINNFKNTLDNLMSAINKKSFKRNIKIKQKNNTNYRNGYSNIYSLSINNKEKNRFIESYYDSMTNTRNKSMKIKKKKIKTNKESFSTYKNSLTFRRNISNDSKLINNTQKSSKNKNMIFITSLNSTKSSKIKKIFNKFKPFEKQKRKTNEKNRINNSKNKEIFSLTERESNMYNRNKIKKNFKINYTSFIKSTNQQSKIFGNQLNTSNFNYIIERPKSFRNKKEKFKIMTYTNKNKKDNFSLPKGLNKNNKILKTDYNTILRERINNFSKSVKYKRNHIYNKLLFSKNNSKVDSSLFGSINTNININLNINKKINNYSNTDKNKEMAKKIKKESKNINLSKNKKKRFNSIYSAKNNNSKVINYSHIELKKKKYRDTNKNRKVYNNNIINNKSKFNLVSYTDRIYPKKNLRSHSSVNKA